MGDRPYKTGDRPLYFMGDRPHYKSQIDYYMLWEIDHTEREIDHTEREIDHCTLWEIDHYTNEN